MAKRRYNSKKIANTPSLKKRTAQFCAEIDAKFGSKDINLIDILYKGHRGYISYHEDDLAKEFDKRIELLRDKYSAAKVHEDKRKEGSRWYRQSDEFAQLELWYEEGVNIANEIFEEKFLV